RFLLEASGARRQVIELAGDALQGDASRFRLLLDLGQAHLALGDQGRLRLYPLAPASGSLLRLVEAALGVLQVSAELVELGAALRLRHRGLLDGLGEALELRLDGPLAPRDPLDV